MKNLLTVILCIVSFAAFSQSFNNTFPHSGFGDQVELEETGYRVMGFGNNITGNHLLVIHVDKYGDTLQTRKIYFDFDFFSPTFTLRSASDRDGNHYVNFSHNADSISIVKLSPDWQEIWRKNLTNKQSDITALKVTNDNHIIAVTSQRLFKLDVAGNVIWQQYFGETDVIETRANSIVETGTGDLFLYSIDYWAEPGQFYWEMPTRPKLRIYSQNGEMRDSTLLPGYTGSSISYGSDYICLGSEQDTPRRTLLYRHDINGLIFQEREIHLGENVRLYSMVENHEGNLVALGYLDNNVVLHCMTKEGDSLWTRYINNEAKAVPMNMKLAADGGYVISYFFEANDGTSNPGLIKTDALGNISSLGFEERDINQRVKVYPNPASEYVVFELQKPMHSATITVTDITGRLVATIPLTAEKTTWQTAGLPSGVYLYRIEDAATIASGRLVILNE
jgi:hypothetical protein